MSDGVIRAGQAAAVWVVIGDTTVSSPQAEVRHNAPDPSLYAAFKCCAIDFLTATPGVGSAFFAFEVSEDGEPVTFNGIQHPASDTTPCGTTIDVVMTDTKWTGHYITTAMNTHDVANQGSLDFSGGADFTWYASDDNDAINIASGRFITYGLLRPV